jgi:hypothetical protein
MKAMAKAPEQRFATAADFRAALLSMPLDHDEDDEDITTAMFVRDVPVPDHAYGTHRSWVVPIVLAAVIVVVLGTVAYLFWQSQTGKKLLTDSTTKPTAQATILKPAAHAFDPPPGDGHEHDADLPKLLDGDPATLWTTEQYHAGFAGLKEGVGFTLVLDSPQKLAHLQVLSPVRGWSASVYVSSSPHTQLAEWGAPVDSHVVNGPTTFNLHGKTGTAVLVWITDLGRNQTVTVGEAHLTS